MPRSTEKATDSSAKLKRIALQQLESLQRAGVTQIPRSRKSIRVDSNVQSTLPTVEPVCSEASSATTPTTQPKPIVQPTKTEKPNRNAALDVLRQEVAACRRCEHLACARTQTVFGVGADQPRVCFFGEAPGADEDRTGEPFVGRAGQLLTDIIEKGMKLRRSDVYILNVLKCRPPDNRTPTDEEMENCREFFERQFEVLKPEFICCLGATATKALLGPIQSLGRMRHKWFDFQGARVMVTYHPSYLLRNPAAKKDTWEDIQMLMSEMGLPIEKK